MENSWIIARLSCDGNWIPLSSYGSYEEADHDYDTYAELYSNACVDVIPNYYAI